MEDLIEDFGGSEDKSSKPETVPLEKRIERITSVDDKDEECHMEDGEVNGMECLPLFLYIGVIWCGSLAPCRPPVVGASIVRWFKELDGSGRGTYR